MNYDDLTKLINSYAELKSKSDEASKETKTVNDSLKNAFKELDLSEYITDLFKVTLITQSNDKLNEAALIEFLKDNMDNSIQSKIIKTKEYIDQDALEDAMYNGIISATLIGTYIEHKEPIYKLMIKRRK